ncbi:aminoacyl-tRNA hydrolase [Buchnera aphidicola]|uniref:aminoacyl-tRNA hydrolase n=1 Tax=Buchnera aphidicola TaxID=9 RepID=UPI002238DA46|nr:aminoacyl-tRNA hydrolase [Buchnera aphidicola]MCW5197732.1 aminoacyl-tRNA hydrolase [Buchnera aphidicola (Chaitophorus viminalis)]
MIVGLGNPFKKYNHTRHNVGIWYLEILSKFFNVSFKKSKKFSGYISKIFLLKKQIILFIPNIFMNLNGVSIFQISNFYNINLNEILIVHDELDLLPGILKFKYGYGSNGHKGLKSIIQIFQKKIFYKRLSIGIGRPQEKKNIANFVLSKPTFSEKKKILKSINKSIHLIFSVNIKNFKYITKI